MANPNFTPETSTNQIYRDIDDTRCLTDDLDNIEADIESLQDGKADTSHTHTGYANADHTHNYAAISHTHNQSEVNGLATALANKADLVNGKVPESQLPSYVSDIVEAASVSAFPATGAADKIYVAQDTNKTYRWSGSGYVEISASIAIGETPNTAYRGDHGKAAYEHSQNGEVHITAEQKEAWNSKAAGNHNHDANYIAKALQFVNDNGGVEYFYGANSGKNLLTEMAAWPQGIHTAYSIGGTAGNPSSNESWRIFAHKTSDTIGWVLAFGTSGSVYSNYYDTTWKGWKVLYDAIKAPLWTGEMYMSANQVVTPSKALSECANGWVLLWGDYNPGEGVQNVDFATTIITKHAYSGQKWNGGQWLCVVPRFADSAGEAVVVKTLAVHDTKLVGVANNSVSPRNDVVLRAVYEY